MNRNPAVASVLLHRLFWPLQLPASSMLQSTGHERGMIALLMLNQGALPLDAKMIHIA